MVSVVDDLKNADEITLSIDTSNHGPIKCLPLLIRYFDKHSGLNHTKLLDFVKIKSET